jgi:error-prone DNA polymerase
MSAYAEFGITSNFSFLRGASEPEELVAQTKILGLAGLGFADRNSVAGVVRAHVAARELGIKFAPGARLCFADGTTPDILVFPQDRHAWGRLTRLLSIGKRRAEKGDCLLGLADLLDRCEGQNIIVIPPLQIDARALGALLGRLKKAASHRSLWLGASMLYRGDDTRRLKQLIEIARDAFVPLIATNDVLYHTPERRQLQDVVTCIREKTTIDRAGRLLEANAERHLKSPDEMERLFRTAPQAIAETERFLSRCRFSLEELRGTEYPKEKRRGFATPQEALVAFAEEGAKQRYPNGIPSKVRHALNEELRLIGELKYAPFFLTVHDIVQFARTEGILCQGRGSAANSVICYCLRITEVDPATTELLFERFVSAERREPPDIDVDFEHERREEVIQYIYRTYTRERAGLAATVICYRGRSAIRDVGKVFGLSEDVLSRLSGTMWGWSMTGVTEAEAQRAGFATRDRRFALVLALARELIGFPRHLSQHVGGFVMTRSRLDEVVPIENAAMEDRTVIEWEKNDLEALGLLKVDVLALGMLSCLRRGFAMLHETYGVTRTLSEQEEDEQTYEMIRHADTIGVFQIESRAQMSMLPRLKPKEFYDLVIEVAIVRPGPIQGNMVHPYLRRRQNPKLVSYPSDDLESILKRTLGVPLFQEQAMRIAIVGAGFLPGEADRLRRAMATFKLVGTIDSFREKFLTGMAARGYSQKFATDCWSQIEGFGSYGFPESHAASFANLVYASAWMKCHYPDVFAAALLNSQPMGFYAVAQLVRDAEEHGVEVRPPDINRSNWDCTLEDGPAANKRLHPRYRDMKDAVRSTSALRLGFRQIGGFPEADARKIEAARGDGFDSIRDLWLRTGLNPSSLDRLAAADAFGSLGLSRREALWAVKGLQRSGDKDDLPLFACATMPELEPDAHLPPMRPGQQVLEDYRRLRLSLRAHPVSFIRSDLDRRGIVAHERLPTVPQGTRVTVAGLVLVRQRPGEGKAIFMTLEDEGGIANTIVWIPVFERYRPIVLGARLVAVTGKLQNEAGVIHIVADHMEDLTRLLSRLVDDEPKIEPPEKSVGLLPNVKGHPRSGDALVTMLKHESEFSDVMPKGRNFH